MNNFDVLILNPEQYPLWDTFVELSPQGDVFCHSWWLEAITKSHFKIMAIIDDNGEIVAGIPMPFDARNRVNEPPLTRTLGVLYKNQGTMPVHDQVTNQRKWLNSLLEHLLIKDFVQMCMHPQFIDWLPFRWKGFMQTTRYTYIIDYNAVTVQTLWNGLSSLPKRMVHKAMKTGIHVEETNDLNLFYDFVQLTYQRQGELYKMPYKDLVTLDDAILKNGQRLLLKAVDKNQQVHAMQYLVYNKKSVFYLLSGSDPQFRKLGGHSLIMWEAIKYFSNKVAYFNMGGSMIERIEKHFRGYGGTLTPYFHIYNENYANGVTGIRFHIKQATFHLSETIKIIRFKMLKF